MTLVPIEHEMRAWRVGVNRELTLDRPRLMGILNVTPDSFSDGGAYASVDGAVAAAMRMIAKGATILDVGGESTRPGAASVDAQEQIARTAPVIAAIRQREGARSIVISIDTTRAAVAEAALDAGADVINDVSAGTDDDRMLALAAARHCGLVLMHRLARPADDSYSTHYTREPDYSDMGGTDGGVYAAVRGFLDGRVRAALSAGVQRDAIVIDPGLGFGKSVAQNYELAARLGELQRDLNLPALSAASRKSFLARPPDIGDVANQRAPSSNSPLAAPQSPQRLAAGIALTLSHWQTGIRLFRVHDVAAHAAALAAFAAGSTSPKPRNRPA